jgi:endonuclease/exonuclease/phosphatase family metal-dependent hydrolase
MRRTSFVLLALASLGVVLLAGCSDSGDKHPSTSQATSPAPAPAKPVSLSLLVFNVEYGGTHASDAVIADLKADVVGVLESYNRLPKIAKAAGYPYYDVGLQIMSKYPILEPSGADGLYSYIEVRPGEAVAMINTHLDYVHDGPNRLNRGGKVEDVLATEKAVRLSSIDTLLPSVTHLLDKGWPLLFTGDLNEPSHLDWTAQTAAQHKGVGAVAWPVSEALIGAGLHDSYRTVHPDPVTDPGNTWGGVASSKGSPRRIDYAYVGGPVDVKTSQVIGERGGDSVDRGYPKWTSDHRAVLSQLEVTPAPIPPTVALSSRMLTVGDEVTVSYRMPAGADTGTVKVTGPSTSSYDVTGDSGTVQVKTDQLAPGPYRVGLVHGDDVVASNDLYVRPKAAKVELTTDKSSYAVGDPVTVHWANGPANRWDWVGIYRAGAANPEKDNYTVWGYTGGHDAGALPPTTEGELVLGREHQGKPWPLPPGRYVAHYLLTDQYISVGSTTFTVH